MLTTLESNFVQEYKMNGGNAKDAVIKAGYKAKYPSALGSQLLKKPKISKLINRLQERTDAILTQPCVAPVYVSPKTLELPTREEYALTAWKRSSDESKLKDDLKHKYYETTGKVLGHIGNGERENNNGDVFQILCKELNLSLSQNSDSQTPQVVVDSDIRLTQNISDGKNIHTPSLSDIEGDTSNTQALASSNSTTQPNNSTAPQDVTEGKKIE